MAGSPALFWIMSCLDNIIGISRTDHICFTESFSAEARKSTSGLYMDELEGFPRLDAFKKVADSGMVTLEEVLTKARDNAIVDFKEQLVKEVSSRYTSRAQAYIGAVGEKGYTGVLNITDTIAGVVLDMECYKGAVVTVEGIKPCFNNDGTISITVYRAIKNGSIYSKVEEVATFEANTTITNPAEQAITPIELAATDDYGTAYSYLFMYTKGNLQPRNNKNTCGCGSKEKALHTYLYPSGVSGSDVNSIALSSKTNTLNGLLLIVKAQCTGGNYICENYNENSNIKIVMDATIRKKAVSNAIIGLLTSPLVSYYTDARREQMSHTVHILNSKFKSDVAWIAENMNLSTNACFECNYGNSGTGGISTETIYM